MLSAGLLDIHESVDVGRDRDEEEEEVEVGEGESWGDEEVEDLEVEDGIDNGGHRYGHAVGSIVDVSSSEVVRSMRGICS